MTGNRLLLDTNIVIDFFKGNKYIFQLLEQQEAIYIAAAVLGELLLGAYRSVNPQVKTTEIESFLTKCEVKEAKSNTAQNYASAKASLLRKGKPIPDNDIWIAATAIQHNLLLFTSDAHFREVDGLLLFNPLASI